MPSPSPCSRESSIKKIFPTSPKAHGEAKAAVAEVKLLPWASRYSCGVSAFGKLAGVWLIDVFGRFLLFVTFVTLALIGVFLRIPDLALVDLVKVGNQANHITVVLAVSVRVFEGHAVEIDQQPLQLGGSFTLQFKFALLRLGLLSYSTSKSAWLFSTWHEPCQRRDVSSCLPDKKHFKTIGRKSFAMTPDPSASTQKNVHYLFQPLGEYPKILRYDLPPLSEGVKIVAHDFLSDFQRFFLSHH